MIWNESIECMDRESLRKIQSIRLKKTVERVYHDTPFYRKKMQELGVTPDDINSIDDIVKLPFTTKYDLRDNYPFGLCACFHLKQKDIDYINEKGLDTIRQHAKDFIAKREAPAYIANDGKQTPMRGHPVFIAQHATATCCRECIRKWHKIQPGKELSQVQQDYLVDVIMTWIQKEIERQEHKI